jgi:hypothetical protein
VKQHTVFAERLAAAHTCAEQLGLTLPTLVDGMDNAASDAFAAWPERIYIVNRSGQIHYRGEPGPWGFDPEEAQASLVSLLNMAG